MKKETAKEYYIRTSKEKGILNMDEWDYRTDNAFRFADEYAAAVNTKPWVSVVIGVAGAIIASIILILLKL